MNIVGLPALTETYENYIWVLHTHNKAWVIDPGESEQVLDYLNQHNLELQAILITHKHHDHINGIQGILQRFESIDIYGPVNDQLDMVTIRCKEGDEITLDQELILKVVETPGHTPDHICFYNDEYLFSGDTLFTAGCGRILGGTPEQYAQSLLKLRTLPDSLLFFCAHEYTDTNLRFAQIVEPNNIALQNRIEQTHICYPKIHIGAQSTLGLEKATNPFLRFDHENIKPLLTTRGAKDNDADLFLTLREWKDEFDRQN